MFALAQTATKAQRDSDSAFPAARQAALSTDVCPSACSEQRKRRTGAHELGKSTTGFNASFIFLGGDARRNSADESLPDSIERRIFAELSSLSDQRSELAQALIASQNRPCVIFRGSCMTSFGTGSDRVGSLLKARRERARAGRLSYPSRRAGSM